MKSKKLLRQKDRSRAGKTAPLMDCIYGKFFIKAEVTETRGLRIFLSFKTTKPGVTFS